jgi:hypothetical protein
MSGRTSAMAVFRPCEAAIFHVGVEAARRAAYKAKTTKRRHVPGPVRATERSRRSASSPQPNRPNHHQAENIHRRQLKRSAEESQTPRRVRIQRENAPRLWQASTPCQYNILFFFLQPEHTDAEMAYMEEKIARTSKERDLFFMPEYTERCYHGRLQSIYTTRRKNTKPSIANRR